jgi:hypothetical protein
MVWLAWVIDYFCDSRELIGVYIDEESAKKAIDIVIDRAKEVCPDNTPDGRYDYCWEEVPMNAFNETALYIFS